MSLKACALMNLTILSKYTKLTPYYRKEKTAMVGNLKSKKTEGFTRTNSQKSLGGFTVIEVLIVLAIAGLIMLIVFLAVPALQRNSRNTQRKNDVSGILGAVAEYTNNNNGTLPSTITLSTVAGTTWFLNDATASAVSGTPLVLGFLNTAGSVTMGTCASVGCGLAANAGIANIMKNAVCAGNVITNAGATGRNIAVLYAVEPGNTAQCQQS